MSEENGVPRLGLAGAGLPAVDRTKAEQGIECEIPSGRLKGIKMVVRRSGGENPHQRRFFERWADGEFIKSLKSRMRGEEAEGLSDDELMHAAGLQTQTPEYITNVLIADLLQPIEIPEKVEALDGLPESIHAHYKANGAGFRLKANRKPEVGYSPDVGVWLVERYPQLGEWARIFANREHQYLEERVEHEGNA